MKHLIMALALLMLPLSALAQDEAAAVVDAPVKEEAKVENNREGWASYSPDHCEFTIEFPEAPASKQQCEMRGEKQEEKCYDLTTYTQVFDMVGTVNFRVICNPVDAAIYNDYSAEVMEATLRAMTKDSVVEEYNSAFREDEGFKQAALVGAGKSGKLDTIYIAQLWIGKQSAFSIEADLIGDGVKEADELYTEILKSIRYTGIKNIAPAKKTEPPKEQ